jgi:hypothetical protein
MALRRPTIADGGLTKGLNVLGPLHPALCCGRHIEEPH